MKVFYHGSDMDGICSAAIIYQKLTDIYTLANDKYISINYKEKFPFDSIKKGEKVIIVDFSIQAEGGFERLFKITQDVIWIDHHKTAIERNGHLPIKGVRDIEQAACFLTWDYFFPDRKMPYIVKLLADYDMWKFDYGEDTNALQCGIRLEDTNPAHANWFYWLGFRDYLPEIIIVNKLIKEGKTALKYRNNTYCSLIKSWSFEVEFEGHKSIACNAGSVSSQLFDSVANKEQYDLFIPFIWDGERWTISLHTEKDDIDVSELAKKYGGGGHRKAAGFQCSSLPFAILQR